MRDGTPQRGPAHLLHTPVGITTRNRPKHDAASGKLRSPRRSLASAPRPLLAIGLGATAGDPRTVLRTVGSPMPQRQLASDFRMKQIRPHTNLEDLRVQIQGSGLLVRAIYDVHAYHPRTLDSKSLAPNGD